MNQPNAPRHGSPPPDATKALANLGISLSPEAWAMMAAYVDRLLTVNRRMNLTAVRDVPAAWHRHVVDSLTLLPRLDAGPDNTTLVDVGSGGGLPGIPLAIARPALGVCLVEATGKKAAFLTATVEAMGLANCRVVAARAETIGHDRSYRQQFDVATCRAVGSLRENVEYLLPLVRIGGRAVALMGPSATADLAAAAPAVSTLGGQDLVAKRAYPQGWDNGSVIVEARKIRPTPNDYPRVPGTPKRSPL